MRIGLLCAWLASCSVYDPSLLPARDAAFDAARADAGDASDQDGGDNDAGPVACVPSGLEFCPEICPETCNGVDDDCDERIDEGGLTLCRLANARAECDDGQCLVVACLDGASDCDGIADNGCEARLDSPEHCGVCNLACDIPGASARCVQGRCLLDECLAGFGDCDGNPGNGCELRIDSLSHCGGCGISCGAVAQGQPGCVNGACGVSECDLGFGDCDGVVDNGCEVSLDSLDTCGTCETACMFDHASALCAAQGCVPGACEDGYGDCDGQADNDCEANLNTDPSHCGACNRSCADLGGSGSFQCVAGECVVTTCPTGFADCDDNGDNGCETSLTTLTDCGGCDLACARDHASASCATGTCTVTTCESGYGNCDNNTNNGCETSLDTDADCGACDAECGVSDSRTCSGGVCSLAPCPNGLADCNNDGADCEQSLSTLLHCGACNARCGDTQGRLANASATCASGACAIGMCDANFANCDGAVNNGCETSLRTNASCGACNVACSRPNASASCTTGTCTLGTCNAGYGNCDGNANNGCETTTTTTANCGGCGVGCDRPNAVMACTSGACTRVACNPGFGDCDGNANNGCEQALNTLTHCGACNSGCALANGAESCSGGTCTLGTCDTGFGNCNFMAGDGCETALNTNSNCNACGTQCDFPNANESCASRTCTLGTCNAGFDNCDNNNANGCEQSLSANNHCGVCNRACGVGERCNNGTCEQGFSYTASNFDPADPMIVPAAHASLSCNAVFNSTPGAANNGFTTWCGQPMPTPVVRTQSGGPDVVILAFESLSVSASLQLIGTRPVILAVYGDAMISGTIDASANGTTPGAGGNWMCGSSRGSNGEGSCGSNGTGGGGGGFGGNGGRGGAYSGSNGPIGGVARGNMSLQPLLGGCDGGHGGGSSNGRAGGGAVQVSVGGTLTFSGTVRANGAQGGTGCSDEGGGGGGGSGGAILLEANVMVANGGTAQARGGNGGVGVDGGGGSGSTTLSSPNGTAGATDNDGAGGGGGAYGRAYLRGVASCTNNVINTVKAGACM